MGASDGLDATRTGRAAETSEAAETISGDEFRRRASAGLFVTAAWSSFNLVLGFAGTLVLARLLVPRDFGLFALGSTVLMLIGVVSDAGLAAGLLRRPETPARAELRALVALHLSFTLPLAVVVALVALQFGEAGAVIAVMIAALPLTAFQGPARLMFNRMLLFQRISVADAAGPLAFYAWSITGVALGFGVWALATGAVVRTLAAGIVLVTTSPLGFVGPSFAAVRRILPVIGFGLRFQTAYITVVARDQVLNVGTGAIGGIAVLGLWSFVYRLMQGPMVFFESLWRVSYPAMVRFLGENRPVRPMIEKSVALSATGAALFLAPLLAASPELVPAIFGEQWRDAAAIVPFACTALLVSGPISVSTVGYLNAAGDAATVLRAAIAYAVTWVVVALSLLPALGVVALGLGWFAGSIVDALVLGRAASRRSAAAFVAPLALPAGAGVAAGWSGWLVTTSGDGLDAAIAGGAVGATLFVGVVVALRRRLLLETFSLAYRSVRAALPRSARDGSVTEAAEAA